MELFNRLTE